jgi:hypothetical protein
MEALTLQKGQGKPRAGGGGAGRAWRGGERSRVSRHGIARLDEAQSRRPVSTLFSLLVEGKGEAELVQAGREIDTAFYALDRWQSETVFKSQTRSPAVYCLVANRSRNAAVRSKRNFPDRLHSLIH